jgi:phenylacetate-CoA ligase
VLGTGFVSTAMPLIRYDTGDLATVVDPPSSLNCRRLRVKDLVSCWKQEYLVTIEGALVTPTVLYENNSVARQFQFVQTTPGQAILRVVPEPGVGEQQLRELVETINAGAGGLLETELEVVAEIPASSRGKRRFVEQHLDLSRFEEPLV